MHIWSSDWRNKDGEAVDTIAKKVLSVIVYGSIVCAIILIFSVLHRALGNPFIPLKEYRGVSFYTSGEYSQMEKGELFVDAYHSLPVFAECEVTDFYHIDKATYDSIFYGKKPDLYALTIKTGDSFDQISDYVLAQGTYIGCIRDLYYEQSIDFYLLNDVSEDVSNRFVVAFGEEQEYVWFYLLTDCEDEDISFRDYEIAEAIWHNIPKDWLGQENDLREPF